MGLFDWFGRGKKRAITLEEGLAKWQADSSALLIDVRTREEFAEGHIPGAVCVPLDSIEREIFEAVPDPSATLYLYCRSGMRAMRARTVLRGLGYVNTENIGGIDAYRGEKARGKE